MVVDPGWESFGAASEIITSVTTRQNLHLISNPLRITLPDSHTPMSLALEEKYYINAQKIVNKIKIYQ